MMIIEGMDFTMQYAPFPAHFRGHIEADSEGRANILISSKIAPRAQESALKHELRHYELGHPWQYDKPAEICEAEVAADPRLRSAVYDRNGDCLLEGNTWQD